MKGKFQRTIYVEDTVWDGIKKAAKIECRSVSNYLVTLHKASHLTPVSRELDGGQSVISPRGEYQMGYSKARQLGRKEKP